MANRSQESIEQRRAYWRSYAARPDVAKKREARNKTEPEMAAARERALRWRANNPETDRNNKLRDRYGITVEVYEQMCEVQGGVCAVCQRASSNGRRLSVDHDHSTGAVRGLLCHRCNSGLGHLKDDLATVERLVVYLKNANAR